MHRADAREQRVSADAVAIDVHRQPLRLDGHRETAVVKREHGLIGQICVRQVERQLVAARNHRIRAAARAVDLRIPALEQIAHRPRRHHRPRAANIALERHSRHACGHIVLNHWEIPLHGEK